MRNRYLLGRTQILICHVSLGLKRHLLYREQLRNGYVIVIRNKTVFRGLFWLFQCEKLLSDLRLKVLMVKADIECLVEYLEPSA